MAEIGKRPREGDAERPKKRKSRFAEAPGPYAGVVQGIPGIMPNIGATHLMGGSQPPVPTTDFSRLPPQAAEIAAAVAKAQAAARAFSNPLAAGIPPTDPGVLLTSTPSMLPVGLPAVSSLEERKQAIAAQIDAASTVLRRSNALLATDNGANSDFAALMAGMSGDQSGRAVKAQDFTLRLDEMGRAVDASGNVIKQNAPVRTLKANVSQVKVNPYLDYSGVAKPLDEGDAAEAEGANQVDPRIKTRSRHDRAKKTFQFHKQGVFVKQGDAMRVKETSKLLSGLTSGRNSNAYKKEGFAGESALEIEQNNGGVTSNGDHDAASSTEKPDALPEAPGMDAPPPNVEWWDVPYLPQEKRSANGAASRDATPLDCAISQSKFHKLVLHPTPVKPLGGKAKEPSVPVYLTKKERKRIRRQAREERQREQQDKIALGLMAPPEPKLKLANFMKVLGDQAVADPSKIERKVMEQVQARVMNHEMRNQARKLTPAERKEKKRKKLAEDTSLQVTVALFRVLDMSDKQLQFKVDMNAQQNNLTGGVLQCKGDAGDVNISLVVIEGGPKAVKRYTRLMLHRIKWSGDEFDEDDDDDDDAMTSKRKQNRCDLVWIGTAVRRNFNAFRFQDCKSAAAARKVMESKGVAHLWDMVVRGDVMDPAQSMLGE